MRIYQVDGRSTEMQSILQIKEISSRWEINQDAKHPTDHGDIEQTVDQQRCRENTDNVNTADISDMKDTADIVDTADMEDTANTLIQDLER